MIIGGNFNKKGKKLLVELAKLSSNNRDHRVSVKELNEVIKLERGEIKNLLEYLESKGFLKIETIGGPFLYGDITITEKGVLRAEK